MRAENIEKAGDSKPAEAAPRRRTLRYLALSPLAFLLLFTTLWAAAALYFDVRVPWLRLPLAGAYLVAVLAVWIFIKHRWLAAGLTCGGFALVLGWWFTLQPSNERDWQPDVAVLSYADIGYHLEADMADQTIAFIQRQKSMHPDKPWIAYYAPNGHKPPIGVPAEFIKKYKGKFDDGYDKLRERILARQKEMGIVPASNASQGGIESVGLHP